MPKKLVFLLLFLPCFVQISFSQAFDIKTFNELKKATNKIEFVSSAKAANLTVEEDLASECIFAKKKGCLYTKPLGVKSNNEFYDLILIVSTLNKENNKQILKNASEDPNKKGTWTDKEYLYIEWDTENPISKEMWYKVLVYKKN